MTKRKSKVNRERAARSLQSSVSGHVRQLHDFVNKLMEHARDPGAWPLTPQEQTAFVRTTLYQARKLSLTEDYRAAELQMVTEDLVMSS